MASKPQTIIGVFSIALVLCFVYFSLPYEPENPDPVAENYLRNKVTIEASLPVITNGTIEIEGRTYHNRSLGLNHLGMCETDKLLTPNRKKPDLKANIIDRKSVV